MKFTKIPTKTFSEIQLNAGILLANFNPAEAVATNDDILGATSGGISFKDTPTYTDYGEDIDNCPKNTMELKKVDSRDISLSGTYVTVNTERARSLIATADVSGNKITPRDTLKDTDFADIWWVGDYSDKNGETTGGFIAIRLMNALSTGGFSVQSGDKAKGQYAFTYTAHYSISNQDIVPYEVYIQAGTEEETATVNTGADEE